MLEVRELHSSRTPGADEARHWIGNRVEDVYGAGIGRVEDVLVNDAGAPTWLVVREGRFTTHIAAIPFEGALGSPGHVWVPISKEAIKSSPAIPENGDLSAQLEERLRLHYAAHGASQQA